MKYIYIYIYIYTAIFPPSNNKCYPTADSNARNEQQRTAKFYTQNFMFFLRTSSERFQILFALLCFHLLYWKILSVPSLSKNKVFILLSSSIGCSLANRDTKDPIVMIICLMNGKEWSNRPLTKSHQRDPKSIFKCSLGHQNNAQQSFVSTLCCRYVHNISTHNGKYI